ncbi:MAG: hypothetical protein JXA20_01410 [Spirochaetes bacterium]|nr:hypothetical protein [Spirochaetota bacterium]
MNRKEMLDDYLQKHEVPELIANKLNANSFLTDNFAYSAMRIGNSIGDLFDISIEIVLLEEVAKRFNLILNTTEHAELHSRGVTEKDLDSLIKGAVLFENIKHNKKQYKHSLKEISDFTRKQMDEIIRSS